MNTHFTLPALVFSKLRLAFSISRQGERHNASPLVIFQYLAVPRFGIYNFSGIWQNADNRLSSFAKISHCNSRDEFGSGAKCKAFAALELSTHLQSVIFLGPCLFLLGRGLFFAKKFDAWALRLTKTCSRDFLTNAARSILITIHNMVPGFYNMAASLTGVAAP